MTAEMLVTPISSYINKDTAQQSLNYTTGSRWIEQENWQVKRKKGECANKIMRVGSPSSSWLLINYFFKSTIPVCATRVFALKNNFFWKIDPMLFSFRVLSPVSLFPPLLEEGKVGRQCTRRRKDWQADWSRTGGGKRTAAWVTEGKGVVRFNSTKENRTTQFRADYDRSTARGSLRPR